MFEDSTFESTGRIRTRSRGWMVAAFAFNASILLAFILIPLIHPEALPPQFCPFLMEAPAPPPAPQPLPPQRAQAATSASRPMENPFLAPRRIPPGIFIPDSPEAPVQISSIEWESALGVPGGTGNPTFSPSAVRVVRPEVKAPVRVSGSVEEGLLIQKKVPVYPSIGLAAHVEGTVTLAATISKTGTIENLRVTGGPALLQQSALDAVRTWRYRPYLLDGQPVEVETTVAVIFTLNR
jgi:protein TonB